MGPSPPSLNHISIFTTTLLPEINSDQTPKFTEIEDIREVFSIDSSFPHRSQNRKHISRFKQSMSNVV